MQPRWLDGLVAEMAARHPQFPRVTIERLVLRVWRTHRTARIQTFVPLLVRREVVDCLRYTAGLAPVEPEFAAPRRASA